MTKEKKEQEFISPKEILKLYRFAPLPLPILSCTDISFSEKILYGIILMYIGKNGHAWPSQATLSKTIGISLRNTQRMLKKLEDKKYISRKVTIKGLKKSTEYRILKHESLYHIVDENNDDTSIISDDFTIGADVGLDADTCDGLETGSSIGLGDDSGIRRIEHIIEHSENNKRKNTFLKKSVGTSANAIKPKTEKQEKQKLDNKAILAERARMRTLLRSKLEQKDNDAVAELISYWNGKKHLKRIRTKSNTKALKRTYEQIKLRLDQKYTVAELKSFIDWFEKNRNSSFSRMFAGHKTGKWYNFSLHEALLFSDSQIKANNNRKGVASTLKNIPSLFEAFIMGNTSCFDFGSKDSDPILVDAIKKEWQKYKEGYCNSVKWIDYTNGNDKLFERIASQVVKFHDKYKYKFNLLNNYKPPAPDEITCTPQAIIRFAFLCMKHTDKIYELHWLASDSFFFSILPTYLTENGYAVDNRIQTPVYNEEITVEDIRDYDDVILVPASHNQVSKEHDEYLDSLFAPVFYKANQEIH